MKLSLLSIFALAAVAVGAESLPEGIPANYQLVYSQDFTAPDALKDFDFTDKEAWKLSNEGRPALELVKQSSYKPPFRSPVNIARLVGKRYRDVIIDAECLQTGREYGHRDMIFVYGWQSPSKFYYTHIATAADNHAHNCFIVNDAARVKFATETTAGVKWGLDTWRKVRIERKGSDGTVRVFFDDMAQPIMQGKDPTFADGEVGFGSFDDTGKITNIKIYAPRD